jgi:hypothetical protein
MSCGYFASRKPSDPKPNRNAEFRAAYDDLLATTDFGETGWPSVDDCDGLLWAGIASAGGVSVDLTLSEYEAGEWHRRPPPACWDGEDNGARSTISNDMIIGLLWGLWRARDLTNLTEFADYAIEHDYVIGEPFPAMASRVVLKPNQMSLLGRAIYAASYGATDYAMRRLPPFYAPAGEDYERHIQALGIALTGEINEALADRSLDATYDGVALLTLPEALLTRLDALIDAEPTNPLYHAIRGIYTGDFSTAISLWLDPKTPIPSYVRGRDPQAYWRSERLFTAALILRRFP